MSLSAPVAHSSVNFDGLAQLRKSAVTDQHDEQTLRQVAGQFEALFLNMMLKSMRQASLGDPIFSSSQSDMYRDFADQQLAMNMSSRGGLGLQDVIMRQMGGQLADKLSALDHNDSPQSYSMDTVSRRPNLPIVEKPNLIQALTVHPAEINQLTSNDESRVDVNKADMAMPFNSPESFTHRLWAMAEKAAEKIGVKAEAILSQAALETGWGKHIIAGEDGKSSYNLFNIKAGSQWQGDSVIKNTLEYQDGVAVKEKARFRAYESFEASFADYIHLLQSQPRYRKALEQAADPELFIESLHKAGYATDPAYADKIKRIMNSDVLAALSQPSSLGVA